MSLLIFHEILRAPGYHGNQGKNRHEIHEETFPNMDLDLSIYIVHYDKEKNLSLDHTFFEVIAEESYRDPRKCAVSLSGPLKF